MNNSVKDKPISYRSRLKVLKKHYKVDSKNKVITCTLLCDMNFKGTSVYYDVYQNIWEKRFPFIKNDDTFKVIGKARCAEGDTFDETLGKRIAESRAKKKAFYIAARVWFECVKKFSSAYSTCMAYSEANYKAVDKEIKHLKELMK